MAKSAKEAKEAVEKTEATRKCIHCKEEKPAADFPPHRKNNKTHRGRICRVCKNGRNRKYGKNNNYIKGEDLHPHRPYDGIEVYLYLVGRYEMGQTYAQIAYDHKREVAHIKKCLQEIEKLRPDLVGIVQIRGLRREGRRKEREREGWEEELMRRGEEV